MTGVQTCALPIWLLLDADAEELRDTRNAQLTTFVSSLMVLDAVERLGIEPSFCAGHSLGEYTALTATGALGFDEGVRLVCERADAMHHAGSTNPGTMAAVLGTMLLGLLAASRSPDAAGALLIGGQAAAVQSQLSFSRDMEREADRVGFGLLTSAGFESQGAIGLFDKLIQAARLNDSGSYPYLRSHPMSTERMADMAGRAQQLGPSAPKAHTDVLHALMSARARALTDKSADAQRQLMLQAQERKATSGIVPPETLAAWYAGALAHMQARQYAPAESLLRSLRQALPGTGLVQDRLNWLAAEIDRKSTRLNSSHIPLSRMPSSA